MKQTHRHTVRRIAGFAILENLVAMTLLGLVIASSSRFIITGMHSNASARNYAALSSHIQRIFDGYRTSAYTTLLSKFSSTYTAIADGAVVTESSTYNNGWATLATTFTAVKTSNTSIPEGVKVSITATQQRGKLNAATFTYETYIAQVR